MQTLENLSTTEKVLIALGLGGLVMLWRASKNATAKAPADAPLTIIGDSFAVGMGASVTSQSVTNAWILNPPRGDLGKTNDQVPLAKGRDLRMFARGGVPASIDAPDDGSIVILSTGSNECADLSRSVDSIVAFVKGRLGAFGRGEATKGFLFYHLPHHQMSAQRPQMAARCKELSEKLITELTPNPRFQFAIIDQQAGPDGIHFSRAQYQALVGKAIGAFS